MDSLLCPPGIPPVGIPEPNSYQFTGVPPAKQASMSPRNSKLQVAIDTTSLMHVNDDDDDANSGLKMPGE
jgi:hypothetical protein